MKKTKMEPAHGWALRSKKTGSLLLPFVYSSRTAARIKVSEIPDTFAVRVRIEEAPKVCRTGCAMINDVPVFCKRHHP